MSTALEKGESKLALPASQAARLDGKPLIEASIREALGKILFGLLFGWSAQSHFSRAH